MRNFLGISLLLVFTCISSRADSPFLVIVNSQNSATSLDRDFVADVFLKKITSWPDESTIRPVDLKADSSARHEFSSSVLNRSVAGIKNYWQQQIFSGRDVPPPELASDRDVVEYVVKNSGAIGYVSGLANLNGVKTVGLK